MQYVKQELMEVTADHEYSFKDKKKYDEQSKFLSK